MATSENYDQLRTKANLRKFPLKTVAEYYEKIIMPYIYVYQLQLKNGNYRNITLKCSEENFCHLLSLESIVKNRRVDKTHFKGDDGWQHVIQGHITYKHLSELSKEDFEKYADEFCWFHHLDDLLMEGIWCQFDAKKLKNSRLDSEYLIFYQAGKDLLVLGIDSEDRKNYFPRTFFVEQNTPLQKSYYYPNQDPVKIERCAKVLNKKG